MRGKRHWRTGQHLQRWISSDVEQHSLRPGDNKNEGNVCGHSSISLIRRRDLARNDAYRDKFHWCGKYHYRLLHCYHCRMYRQSMRYNKVKLQENTSKAGQIGHRWKKIKATQEIESQTHLERIWTDSCCSIALTTKWRRSIKVNCNRKEGKPCRQCMNLNKVTFETWKRFAQDHKGWVLQFRQSSIDPGSCK
jgi:hypothetical protein